MEGAQTSSQRTDIEVGWSDEKFRDILETAVTLASEDSITIAEVTSPPGTRKTFNVLKYEIDKKTSLIALFPNHQNQLTALEYILSIMESKRFTRPSHYVVDYAGLEKFCLFYKPELVEKLLDKFRLGGGLDDALHFFLGNALIFHILLSKESFTSVEEIWKEILAALKRYKTAGDIKEYRRNIRMIVEKKGQYEVCRSICPIGLLASWYRKDIYKLLSTPKIISWRLKNDDEVKKKYPRMSRHIVHANPEQLVENIQNLLSGSNVKPEWVLCPRHLMISRLAYSIKKKVPLYISNKRFLILAPHAALDFILPLVAKQLDVSKSAKRFKLFLDEYDALIKPKMWRLIPLDMARYLIALAMKIEATPEGGKIRGVEVDKYLKRYAKYVRETLSAVVDLVETSIKDKGYHPLASIFLEGAFSEFKEVVLKTAALSYRPLGARIAHIKHYLEKPKLFYLLLNPKLYFYDLSEEDEDWLTGYRSAVIKFRRIVHGERVPVKVPVLEERSGRKILYLTVADMPAMDVLKILRDYLQIMLIAPRIAIYYTLGDTGLYLASIDAQLYRLLAITNVAILTSATPIAWRSLAVGSNAKQQPTEFEAVVNDSFHSLITISSLGSLRFEDRVETLYAGKMVVYEKDGASQIYRGVLTGEEVSYDPKLIKQIKINIKQIAPLTRDIKSYIDLIEVERKNLPPLSASSKDQFKKELLKYIALLGTLYKSGETILVLTQNKKIANILADVLKATPCSMSSCGDVPASKITHYLSRDRIVITWFRSRATRGIDLPHSFTAVVVVGSPFPRAQTVVHTVSTDARHMRSFRVDTIHVSPYNTSPIVVYRLLLARDFMSGVSELAQGVGRATRSAMKSGARVKVYVPPHTFSRLMAYSPYWLYLAI